MHVGACHCGNIKLAIESLPDSVTTCNCSICSRYAALWAYLRPAEVTVTAGPEGLSTYTWGDRLIDFMRCAKCGCVTHYQSAEGSGYDRLAVNFRMFDAAVQGLLRVRRFDGADSWAYLDG